jgi:glycosyltransferase involved in cell wall biosynthesis
MHAVPEVPAPPHAPPPDASRVAISAVSWHPGATGGLNRYAGEMVRALVPLLDAPTVFSAAHDPAIAHLASVERVPLAAMTRNDFVGNGLRLLWNQSVLPLRLRSLGARVLYSPVPEGMLAPLCPQVITVHDLLPLHYPQIYPRVRHYFTRILPRLIRASSAIVTDSLSTATDIENQFGPLSAPLHVIYPGYDRATFGVVDTATVAEARRRYALSDYVLAVGETRPYKNIRRLIEAFAQARLDGVRLAVVGSANRFDADTRNRPAELGIADRVVFLGRVPDADLAALYAGALCFAFPSLFEGFGIPPLEAMACGAPVIASSSTSIPEVCGDAAVYFDPASAEEMSAVLRAVTSDASLRQRLGEAGVKRAQSFSYQDAASRLRDVLLASATP